MTPAEETYHFLQAIRCPEGYVPSQFLNAISDARGQNTGEYKINMRNRADDSVSTPVTLVMSEVRSFGGPFELQKKLKRVAGGVPVTASEMAYKASGSEAVIYYWQSGDKWYWDCVGNSGITTSKESALEEAKQWVRGESARPTE